MSTSRDSGKRLKLPRVFIGSSKEGLDVAEALQFLLDEICNAELWSNDFFRLSLGTLETLVDRASSFDFAILVLTADDLRSSRGLQTPVPRDNVIFELGLFFGALGRERTFIVLVSDAELPSDLKGTTVVRLDLDEGRSTVSAVSSRCLLLKDAIKSLGRRTFHKGNTPYGRLLEEISIGVRTRYAGPFPQCFEEICRLLKSAQRRVCILSDFPCYGIFSQRALYEKYERILKKLKRNHVELQFLFPNAQIRRDLQSIQFGEDDAVWSEMEKDPAFMQSVREAARLEEVRIDSMESLHKYLDGIHDQRLLNAPEFVNHISETTSIPALYTWIVDDQRAIFTIPMFGRNAHEQGFYTSEPDVVGVLKSVWEHYHPTLGPQVKRGTIFATMNANDSSSTGQVRQDSSEVQ